MEQPAVLVAECRVEVDEVVVRVADVHEDVEIVLAACRLQLAMVRVEGRRWTAFAPDPHELATAPTASDQFRNGGLVQLALERPCAAPTPA